METINLIPINPYAVVSFLLISLTLLIAISAFKSMIGTTTHASEMPVESESKEVTDFDFLSTPESIPSQYDIAVAYLAGGQIDKAINMLKTVVASKHPIYSTKALDKISQLELSAS